MVDLTRCMDKLGYRFQNEGLLRRALTHSSLAVEQHRMGEDNERLEYLGDAVLEHLVSRHIFDTHPDELETLTEIVRDCMSNAMQLSVPLDVNINSGSNWLEAH